MTRHYATVAHRAQVPVLAASMRRHCRPFTLHALAWDFDPFELEGVEWTTREDFLAANPDMAPETLPGDMRYPDRPPRRPVDVVATVRWAFLADLITRLAAPVTLIDGDIHFFASPEPVFEAIGDAPFAVTPHRIPARAAELPGVCAETHAKYGAFNAGWVYLADDRIASSLAALNRRWSFGEPWRQDDGSWLYGDQGHLERAARELGAYVIGHPGLNTGPWGIHAWWAMDPRPGLIAYHFSSLRLGQQIADAPYEITPEQQRAIYDPYIRELTELGGG